MKRFIFICVLSLFMTSLSQAVEALPELLQMAPSQKFEILGPISATKKSVEESQAELLFQAQKLDADAVILKNCESGSIQRSGLTWFKAQASCEGLAIRYLKAKVIPTTLPAKPL